MLIPGRFLTEKFGNAKDFLNAIRINHPKWLPVGEWHSPWVFRGQGNADWGLVPSAWREGNTPQLKKLRDLKLSYFEKYTESVSLCLRNMGQTNPYWAHFNLDYVLEANAQAYAESCLINEFILFADSLGHPVPVKETYYKALKEGRAPDGSNSSIVYDMPNPTSTTALAQHHGIPTRCLDWTENPLVAAYFAAYGLDEDMPNGEIAVWAMRPDLFKEVEYSEFSKLGDVEHPPKASYCKPLDWGHFSKLECPKSENLFMHSQKGLFLYPTHGCHFYRENGKWPSLEEYCVAMQDRRGVNVIHKLVLPAKEVGELLRLLWAEGVSRAHLMPTYDNVTASLIAKWKFYDA